MLLGERPAKVRLEILLELNGFVFVSKSNRNINLPRQVLRRMHALPRVVLSKALLKIGGYPNVMATGIRNTNKYVYVIKYQTHGLPRRGSPSSVTVRKPGFAISKKATPGPSSFTC
jgi:hypothetical protein